MPLRKTIAYLASKGVTTRRDWNSQIELTESSPQRLVGKFDKLIVSLKKVTLDQQWEMAEMDCLLRGIFCKEDAKLMAS